MSFSNSDTCTGYTLPPNHEHWYVDLLSVSLTVSSQGSLNQGAAEL